LRRIINSHVTADPLSYIGFIISCKQLYSEISAEVLPPAQKDIVSMGGIWCHVFRRPFRAIIPQTIFEATALELLIQYKVFNLNNPRKILWKELAPPVSYETVRIKVEDVPDIPPGCERHRTIRYIDGHLYHHDGECCKYTNLEDTWRFCYDICSDILDHVQAKRVIFEWRPTDPYNHADRALEKELLSDSYGPMRTRHFLRSGEWDLGKVEGKEAVVWTRKAS
jgi:hypothetical protein